MSGVRCRFDEERLRNVYGMRLEQHRSVRLCYCHVQCWWDGPVDEAQAAHIWSVFDRKWREWRGRVADGQPCSSPGGGLKRPRDAEVMVEAAGGYGKGGERRLKGIVEETLAGSVAGAGGAQVSDTVPDSEDEEENRAVSCGNC